MACEERDQAQVADARLRTALENIRNMFETRHSLTDAREAARAALAEAPPAE